MTELDSAVVAAAERRRQLVITIAAVVVTLLSLAAALFMWFMASLMTYGLYSWQEPELDPAVWLPILGIAVVLPLGPLVMSLGRHQRRWRHVALVAAILGAVGLSLITWVPVALGLR